MCVSCILSALAVKTWFQSIRTLFGRLKKKTLGQGAKPLTARQKWSKANFSFLSAHLCIRTDHSQLGMVQTPVLQVDLEVEDEGGDDEDATSVTSSQMHSQLPSSAKGGSSQPRDSRRPRPGASGSGRKVDEAILKLADRLTQNTGMQDWLQYAVQESARPRIAFCQWMGAEMSNLDEHLWSLFMREAFDLVTRYRDLQTQQPAPPPPYAVQLPPMPPQPQPHQPRPWSAPRSQHPPTGSRCLWLGSLAPVSSSTRDSRPSPRTCLASTPVGSVGSLTRPAPPLDSRAAR